MASLMSLSPSTPPLGFAMAGNSLAAADGAENAGVEQGRMLRNFSQYQLPDLTNRYASRGAFYSGMAGAAGDRLRQGVTDNIGDSNRGLSQLLARLNVNAIANTAGFSL